MRFASISLVALFCVSTAFADPFISEFMASNKSTLADEDGAYSDWVEITNPDATPVNLAGWALTDKASSPQKWIFPAVTLGAKSRMIVFCSSKNRVDPLKTLHTNFSLDKGGEYLGLVKPDGVTRVTEFAPTFPQQYDDISYGISSSNQTVTLVQKSSTVRAFVPTSDALGTTWRAPAFNDAGWTSGTFAVGFFNYGKSSNPDLSANLGLDVKAQMGGQARSVYIRVPVTIDDPSKVRKITLRMIFDDGFAAFLNGQFAASRNAPATASLTYSSLATALGSPTTVTEFDLTSMIPQLVAGTNVLAIQGMNDSATSGDVYMLPELVADVEGAATPIIGYFLTATPNQENGGPSTVQLPQEIALSRPSGTFTASFNLALTGSIAGQQIRYIIADPTSSPGANIAQPTISSTLYTDPIAIASSKLIRAAVFDPVTGQKGKTLTAEYLLLETGSTNNTSNFTSTLPIVVADDHGAGQPVDSNSVANHTTSMLHIFAPVSGVASLNALPEVFTRAGLAVRGKSSQGFPKKSYGLETWDEVNDDFKMPLLGLAKESDWILNGPWAYDDTYIHNAFIYELSRQCGRWAPRTQFVEMFTNSNGGKLDYADYAGVYVLTEKIETGANRLDITEIQPGDISGDALTGGYIFKWDLPDADEVNWKTTRGIPSEDSTNIIVAPKSDKDTSEQVDYIKGFIQSFEDVLYTESAANFSTRNYTRYVDVRSWVDFHILNMLAFNVDAPRLSTFYHKDRNRKIEAGPLWDFDRSLGSDNGHDANPRTWGSSLLTNRYFVINWWGQMFKDPDFVQAWVDRWFELRGSQLSNANLNLVAETLGGQIGDAIGARDAERWPGTAKTGNTPVSGSYLGEIERIKAWLTSTVPGSIGRAPWIDSQLPGPPTASLDNGVVTSGTTVTLGGAGTIRYTKNGSDPRTAGGGILAGAETYAGPVSITQTTTLFARRQGNFSPFPSAADTIWGAPIKRVYLVNEVFATAADLAVSEIYYRPKDPTAAEAALFPGGVSADDFEFIELRNIGNRTVNTFEVKFVQDKPFAELKLDPLTLAPGETALVVKNREAFQARFGTALAAKVIGEWRDGSLSNDGESIQILARDGSTIQSLAFADDAAIGQSLNRYGDSWLSDVPSPTSVGPTYAQWKDYYFPAGGVGGGDNDDDDLDGAPNRIEYAHGTDPKAPDNGSAFAPVTAFVNVGGMNYRFMFTKPVNRPSASYEPQQSANLVDWSTAPDTLVSTVQGVETRAVDTSAVGGRRFFRLKTTVNP